MFNLRDTQKTILARKIAKDINELANVDAFQEPANYKMYDSACEYLISLSEPSQNDFFYCATVSEYYLHDFNLDRNKAETALRYANKGLEIREGYPRLEVTKLRALLALERFAEILESVPRLMEQHEALKNFIPLIYMKYQALICLGRIDEAKNFFFKNISRIFNEREENYEQVWDGEADLADRKIIVDLGQDSGPGDSMRRVTSLLPHLSDAKSVNFRNAGKFSSVLETAFPGSTNDVIADDNTIHIIGHAAHGLGFDAFGAQFDWAGKLFNTETFQSTYAKMIEAVPEFLETERPKIGLAWRTHVMNRFRMQETHLPLTELVPLLKSDAHVFVFQYQISARERATLESYPNCIILEDLIDIFDDIDTLLTALNSIDYLFTTITSIRDIAGAIQVPVVSISPLRFLRDNWRVDSSGQDLLFPSVKNYLWTIDEGRRLPVVRGLKDMLERIELHNSEPETEPETATVEEAQDYAQS